MILLELFLTFFKIGLFTFGGGYAMLPLIQSEVIGKGWMTNEQIVDFIAVSESTPGPFAINMATFIGNEMGGILGGLCATTGVVMPSFIVILIVAKCFDKFRNSKIVKGCMTGLKPAVVGMIGSAIVTVAKTVLFPEGFSVSVFTEAPIYISLGLFAVSTVLAFKKVHPIIIIVISAVVGIVAGFALGM